MEEMQILAFQIGKIDNQRVIDGDDGNCNGLLFPMILLPPPNQYNNPLQIEPGIESFLHTIRKEREWIESELKERGALLFRGFPVKTACDFNAVVEAFGWEEQPYLGAASRTRVHERVYTANEAALHQPIKFHHEMSKFEEFPRKLLFFCEIAPTEGGQTAIVLSHLITQKMEEKYPELVRKLEKEGLFYTSTLPREDHPDFFLKGWQTLFQTRDKEEAEKKAAESLKCKVSWEGSRLVLQTGPLTSIRTFDGNKEAWFNQVAFGDADTPHILGDGSPFPREAIEWCIHIAEEECVEVNWEVGDVLVIDNRLVQHARRPSKPPRRVLAALCK